MRQRADALVFLLVLLFMPRIFSLSILARERASQSTAHCPPIFSIWFGNCRDQAVRAGEYTATATTWP